MDVGAWLRPLGLGRYEQVSRDHDIDADGLCELTADDLVGLGIGSTGLPRGDRQLRERARRRRCSRRLAERMVENDYPSLLEIVTCSLAAN